MGDSGEDREANRKEKTPTQRTADPAIKKEPRSPRVAATQGGREFLPSTDIAIEFDLRTQMWKAMDGVDIPWIEQPRELTTEMLQAVPVKGRHSKKEKDDERKAEAILR